MNKPLLGTLALGLVLVILSVSSMLSTHVTNPSEEGLKYGSSVCVEKNDELVSCGENTLTDAGKNLIQDYLIGAARTNISYIAICNNTNTSADGGGDSCAQPAVGNTVLAGEYFACGLTRASGTLTDQGTGNFSYAYTFTSLCDDVVSNVTGLFNSTSGLGTYFAGNNYTNVTLQTDDELTVTWYVWVT